MQAWTWEGGHSWVWGFLFCFVFVPQVFAYKRRNNPFIPPFTISSISMHDWSCISSPITDATKNVRREMM